MAWQINGTPDTLTSPSDTTIISDLTQLKFNVNLFHAEATAGTIFPNERIGNAGVDTGSNYSLSISFNGAVDTPVTGQTGWDIGTVVTNTGETTFDIQYGINIAGEEKLFISLYMYSGATGSGSVPQRAEFALKWSNTAQYDTVEVRNSGGTGDFNTDTNLSALGTD